MVWRYEHASSVWPMLVVAGFLAALAVFGWRRRTAPGALPFTLVMALAVLWVVGAALELAAVDLATKIFWAKFASICQLLAAIAVPLFALEYANLSRALPRGWLALLWVPSLIAVILAITNDYHQLGWVDFQAEAHVRPVLGAAGQILRGFGFLLALASSSIFLWLAITSPAQRLNATLCLTGHVATRVAYVVETSGRNPLAPIDLTVLAMGFAGAMYALAFFRYRMFDLVPIALSAMVRQMREAMIVVDGQRRIVDLNPAAEKVLGISAAEAVGKSAVQGWPSAARLSALLEGSGAAQHSVSIGAAPSTEHYDVCLSPLKDKRGYLVGHLLLLHDVTEERLAQARILEQQCALAALQERERIARELHDGLAQVLAYVRMQTQAAQDSLARGEASQAAKFLSQMGRIVQEAHSDVREYIVGARTLMPAESTFHSALEGYLRRFSESFGIITRVNAPPELSDDRLEPSVATQLLRIIQEALTNVRKHADARHVDVRLAIVDGYAETTVQDDGRGFDPGLLETAHGQKFGLRFMRERASEVGGTVQLHSTQGAGTRAVIRVPLR